MFTGCRILMQLRRIGSGLGEDEGVNGKTRNGARTTLGPSRPLPPPRNRWFADSPLEGTGFEPSVPPRKRRPSREAPRPTIVGSRDDLCLMTPSSLSVRHLSSATAQRPFTRAGPTVRIRFPPPVSPANCDHAKPTSSECAISSSRLKSHLEANRRRPKDDGAHLFLDHGVRPRPIGFPPRPSGCSA